MNYERKYDVENTAFCIVNFLIESKVTLAELDYVIEAVKNMLCFDVSSDRIKFLGAVHFDDLPGEERRKIIERMEKEDKC